MSSVSDITSLPMRILGTYRAWRDLTQSSNNILDRLNIIIDDMAIAKPKLPHFGREHDVESAIEGLITETEGSAGLQLGRHHTYTLHKLQQSRAFLRQKLHGEQNSLDTVMSRGIRSVELNDTSLDRMSQAVEEGKKFGRPSNRDWWSKEGWDFFHGKTSMDQLPEIMDQSIYTWVQQVHALLPGLATFNYRVRPVRSAAAWRNIVTNTNVKGDKARLQTFELLANTNEQIPRPPSVVECLSIHEACGHMLNFAQLAVNTELQEQAPHLLAIAIHTQDAFLVEGVAQFMTALLLYGITPADSLLRTAFDMFELDFGVKYRNILAIVSGKENPHEVAQRHVHYLGGDTGAFANYYRMISTDVFLCIQILSYHAAFTIIKPALLLSPEKVGSFVQELLSWCHSPDDLVNLVQRHCDNTVPNTEFSLFGLARDHASL